LLGVFVKYLPTLRIIYEKSKLNDSKNGACHTES